MTGRLYLVPYDSGHKGLRMGAGPSRLRREFDLPADEIEPEDAFTREIGTAFDLYRQLATRISANRASVPIVLSGNCGAAIGTAAGVGMDDLALIWFDAHGDFNTPETSQSGFLDGMSLSILTGRCFAPLARTIPGFQPLPFERTIHAGGHDLDASEVADFTALRVGVIRRGSDPAPVLDRVRASRIVVHIDLDVLDPSYGKANHYAKDGGMSPDEVVRIIEACRERFRVAAVVVASYDPSHDADGRVASAAVRFVDAALHFRSTDTRGKATRSSHS